MRIEIRKAVIGDLEEIRKLNRLLFQYDAHYDQTLRMGWAKSASSKKYFESRINSSDFAH